MMKRLNSENMMKQVKNIALRFPLSLLFIIFLTGWQFYMLESVDYFGAIGMVLTTGILLATASQLLYERFFRSKTNIRWLLYAGAVVFIFLYYIYFSMSLPIIDDFWTFYSIPGIRGMIVYFIATILLIWIPSIKNEIKFSNSFLVLFKGWFTSLFFAVVLFAGVILTLFLFENLFFTIDTDWFSHVSILTFSLFLPTLFLTFIPDYQTEDSNEEGVKTVDEATKMPKFLHHLITYILIPVMAVYTLLLVMYILTNLTSVFFEENLLEPLLLTYAINGWIMLILADLIENKMAQLFKKIFPFLLIFVIAFQMLATYFQIQEVGVTHGRYFILLFGVGSIISALWYILKEPRLLVLPVAAVVGGIIALIPPIDAVGFSVRSQVDRVESLLEENDVLVDGENIVQHPSMSETDQEKIDESIRYLRGISALNQLTWLPEEYYHQTDEFLGFTYDYWDRENDEEFPLDEVRFYEISLMDPNNFSFPVERFDFMLNLELENDTGSYTEAAIIDDEMHNLHFNLEDGFIIAIQNDETEEEVELDFSYILDEFAEVDSQMSTDEMTFVEEAGDYSATIIVKNLLVNDDYFMINFLLFL